MTIPTQARDLTVTTSGPTDAHALLVVQLAQLATSSNVDRGMSLLHKHARSGGLSAEQFEATYPIDEPDAMAIRSVLQWFETIGTLVKQGLLDRGLVLDWLWVSGVWEQCKALAMADRVETGSDAMWENFEALAAAQT